MEAEFLCLALKEKMSQKHHDDTIKYVTFHDWNLTFCCYWMTSRTWLLLQEVLWRYWLGNVNCIVLYSSSHYRLLEYCS